MAAVCNGKNISLYPKIKPPRTLILSGFSATGAVGLEPTTFGFGDQRSAN